MNHCWYDLLLDNSFALNSHWSFQVDTKYTFFRTYNPEIVLTKKWIEYMGDLGYPIQTCAVFYKPASYNDATAHVDNNNGTRDQMHLCSFNWVLSGFNSKMIWYELPTFEPDVIVVPNHPKSPFITWPIEKLKEIDRKQITNTPVIARIDIPHNIITDTSEGRWTIAVRTSKEFDSWNDLIDDLRYKNLLIDR